MTRVVEKFPEVFEERKVTAAATAKNGRRSNGHSNEHVENMLWTAKRIANYRSRRNRGA